MKEEINQLKEEVAALRAEFEFLKASRQQIVYIQPQVPPYGPLNPQPWYPPQGPWVTWNTNNGGNAIS